LRQIGGFLFFLRNFIRAYTPPKFAHKINMFKNLKFRYIEAEMIPTIEFIENRLNSVGDEVVNLYALDIGANLGLYSEIFKESGLNVIAVEPLPYLANYLEKVFKHSKSVQVLQLAVGNESTSDKITLRVPFNPKWPLRMQDYDQFTTLSISNSLQNATKIKKIDVSVRMIDEIVPKDANVIIIKIDIEGFEFQALQGAKEILRRCHPIILCEVISIKLLTI
jgi:FkbM family methyltransferase